MVVSNKESLSHWESAKEGDLIQLKDEQTLSYLMEQGVEHISHGADFIIKRRRRITANEGTAAWLLLDIELQEFLWCLVVKSNGPDFDLFVYYTPDGFIDGDRNDIIDNSDWLMEVWEDGTELKDLPFAKEVKQGEDVIFKTSGPQYGTCVEDNDKSFATVVEYSTDADGEENPLLMAIEYNQLEPWSEREESAAEDDYGDIEVEVSVESGVNINEDSSYIMLLQGCSVPVGDVDVLRT